MSSDGTMQNTFVDHTNEHELRGVCVRVVKTFVDHTFCVCLFLIEMYLHIHPCSQCHMQEQNMKVQKHSNTGYTSEM